MREKLSPDADYSRIQEKYTDDVAKFRHDKTKQFITLVSNNMLRMILYKQVLLEYTKICKEFDDIYDSVQVFTNEIEDIKNRFFVMVC